LLSVAGAGTVWMMHEQLQQRKSPFLEGNFAPWRREEDIEDLEICGSLPDALNGTYFRNGPNPAFDPIGRYHWFDGDGMIHAIRLHGGRASYRNRWVRSQGLLEEMRAGRALYYGLLELGRGEGRYKNTANTNVLFHAGKFFGLMEGALPTELDPVSLATRGEFDFGGKLAGPMTAHPKVDPVTGELFFFGYSPIAPYLTFYRADSAGNLVAVEPLSGGFPAMVHDFALTEHHVVFFVCPLTFRLERLGSDQPVFAWEPELGTLWGCLPRYGKAKDIQWIAGDPCFIFHSMNAFEDRGTIVVDVARYPELQLSDLGETEQSSRLFVTAVPTLWRFRIDPKAETVEGEERCETLCEFPRVDERVLGRPYRYGFAAAGKRAAGGVAPKFSCLLRYDWNTGTATFRDVGHHRSAGEPVFVPASAAAMEGDGYILVLVYDEREDRSELQIIASRDFEGDPVATVRIPHRIPYGFHGAWVPGV